VISWFLRSLLVIFWFLQILPSNSTCNRYIAAMREREERRRRAEELRSEVAR
jgi:hypothetical protein